MELHLIRQIEQHLAQLMDDAMELRLIHYIQLVHQMELRSAQLMDDSTEHHTWLIRWWYTWYRQWTIWWVYSLLCSDVSCCICHNSSCFTSSFKSSKYGIISLSCWSSLLFMVSIGRIVWSGHRPEHFPIMIYLIREELIVLVNIFICIEELPWKTLGVIISSNIQFKKSIILCTWRWITITNYYFVKTIGWYCILLLCNRNVALSLSITKTHSP